ncbi:VOC family protein [Neoaquamicrobium sediminum]|uniref:VOC family protein n=1 Tax=Neoaquamicrobium sediminum TaxID=1849104 RepID=UPI0015664A53|nr:VOC family protein [Mesorhizobium sediminum]NRC55444.1 glyoxalase [Mesorhizobium sediminum]
MTTYTAIEPPRIYPTFRFRDAAAMIDWLRDAFGFTVKARYEDDKGVVGHAELAFGSSIIMCGQAQEDEYGTIVGQPGDQGGQSLYVAVENVDALFERVRKAGAAIEQGLTDRDYGSREFICRDPEGNVWCFGTYWPKAHEG